MWNYLKWKKKLIEILEWKNIKIEINYLKDGFNSRLDR